MDPSFRNQVLGVRSKRDANLIVQQIVNHQRDIQELMDCFFSDDWVLCQKTSWSVTILSDKNPEFITPYMQQMLDNLDRPNHDAVIRNTLRSWGHMQIPEEMEGPIYDRCFEYFADPSQAIAIRVFSMTVCANIAMRHPSLSAEIIPIIEDYWDHATPAWRSRGKKELKRLRKVSGQ